MTELLSQAFDEASKLPHEEQDAIAAWLLKELESERRWSEAFAKSQDGLSQMAAEAIAEYRSGKTLPLDPNEI